MKTQLTNKLTKVFFNQYGKEMVLEYNGTATDAREYAKRNYGAKTINTYYTVQRNTYLPKGYASIEQV